MSQHDSEYSYDEDFVDVIKKKPRTFKKRGNDQDLLEERSMQEYSSDEDYSNKVAKKKKKIATVSTTPRMTRPLTAKKRSKQEFSSDDEVVERKPKKSKKRLVKQSVAAESQSSKTLCTAEELFRPDNESESKPSAGKYSLNSYLSKRLSDGISKQTIANKKGSHYIDLKIYKSVEVEKVPPINRWRHAVINLKCCADSDMVVWQRLTEFLSPVRKDVSECPPVIINSYY